MSPRRRVIAIDGPAGAGKSAVARELAHQLGWRYIDTGAMYRAVALAALNAGVDPEDEPALERLAAEVGLVFDGGHVLLDGADVGERIRDDDVTEIAPLVAKHPKVRAILVARQRALADGSDVVMEGRDIAATVVPDADVKVFLTASPRERARRRCLQLGLGEDDEVVGALEAAIAERDAIDSTRMASPLRRVGDAVVVDSTDKTLAEVIDEVAALFDQEDSS